MMKRNVVKQCPSCEQFFHLLFGTHSHRTQNRSHENHYSCPSHQVAVLSQTRLLEGSSLSFLFASDPSLYCHSNPPDLASKSFASTPLALQQQRLSGSIPAVVVVARLLLLLHYDRIVTDIKLVGLTFGGCHAFAWHHSSKPRYLEQVAFSCCRAVDVVFFLFVFWLTVVMI